jgi:hypothetical protein
VPPLNFRDIEKKRGQFKAPNGDTDALRSSLKGMEDAFRTPGDLSLWTPELLDDIDDCFIKNYMDLDGEPVACLFFPDSAENLNIFMSYCSDVDVVLRRHSELVPRYAREYFAYYSIWEMRGWQFPVPLGTQSVIGLLNKMVRKMEKGFSEVS